MNRAGAAAKIGDQVIALLEWADSNIGPGLEAIAHHLAELNHFEFDAYLRLLVATYEKWWEHYTLTDAIGKVESPTLEKPSAFDFGLMVQTVTKEREPTAPENTPLQQDKEKTERLPVLEGIRKYADDHVLLVGRPGSGKSTALIRLLLEEATLSPGPSPKIGRGGQERIPVLVELRYWESSIEGLIQGFLQRHNLALDDATLSTLLSEGEFLLLVDGLNELPSEEARTQLSAFRRNHPKLPMIFTTRDLGLGGDLGIEKKLEMQPLTEAQMKAFIRAYVPDQAEVMLRQLSDRLREFGQTPLLLWMLCEVFKQSPIKQLPNNLGGIFQVFTRTYEDSSVRKHQVAALKGDVKPLTDRRLWKDALKALAALMMQGETPVNFRVAIHRTEAERELGKLFAKEKFPVRDILDDLLKYHLLQNRTTDQLEFRHQLIQEYYAAEYLLQLLPGLTDDQLKRDYLNLLKWTEAIALMLALVDDEAQALRVVKLAIDDVDLTLGAKLAGKVNSTIHKQSVEFLNKSSLPDWLRIYLLGETQSESAVPHLLQSLKNENRFVRIKTEKALEKLGLAAIPSLLEILNNESHDIFMNARKVLIEIAITSFLKALESEDIAMREYGIEGLKILNSEKSITRLLEALQHESSCVRASAAKVLGDLTMQIPIEGLIWATKDEDPAVCASAIEALDKLGETPASIQATMEEIKGEIYDLMNTVAMTDTLEKPGLKVAIPDLLQMIKGKDPYVCWDAVKTLGEMGSEEAIPSMIYALNNTYVVDMRTVEMVVGQLTSEVAILDFLQLLEVKKPGISVVMAKVLENIACNSAAFTLPKLLSLVFKHSGHIACNFLKAIQAIQDHCKFYNYEIWQEAEAVQNSKLEIKKVDRGDAPENKINNFPNAVEVKIIENVEHYYEHPPDSKP
jgi:HEAT repeat protein